MKNFKIISMMVCLMAIILTGCSDGIAPIEKEISFENETQLEKVNVEKVKVQNDDLASVEDDSDYSVISYDEWEEIQLYYKDGMGDLNSIGDFIENEFLLDHFDGDVNTMATYLEALEQIHNENADATYEELLNSGIFTDASIAYIDNFTSGLELYNGAAPKVILAHIDAKFDVEFLVSNFGAEQASTLLRFSYKFKYEIKDYLNNSSFRSAGCNWWQAIGCARFATVTWLRFVQMGIIVETILSIDPGADLAFLQPLCIEVFMTNNWADCADAMIHNSWRLLYDYCCGND